jgi:hypothetical protein
MNGEAPRVWMNSSIANWSFIDYAVMVGDERREIRIEIPPGVGVRLPKFAVEVIKAGHGMREGRAE